MSDLVRVRKVFATSPVDDGENIPPEGLEYMKHWFGQFCNIPPSISTSYHGERDGIITSSYWDAEVWLNEEQLANYYKWEKTA